MGENASAEEISAYEVLKFPLRVGFSSRKSVFEPHVVVIFCYLNKNLRK